MKKIILSIALCFLCINCSNTTAPNENNNNTTWVFVANEGEYDFSGQTNTGTISMIDSHGNVYETENLGDIVQSLVVYDNKLIASVNNSQKILIFDISASGISNKHEIQTINALSPRELIILENKAYFGTWNSDYNIYQNTPGFIQVLNLDNLEIEESIEVGIMPEGLLIHDNFLWVANSGESTITKIDISSNSVFETIDVGPGPQNLIHHNDEVYVSRTFYDDTWNTFHGSSKIISSNVPSLIKNYGSGAPCGGSVMVYGNQVYRSYEGGIAPLDAELNINTSSRIGNYSQTNVYHVEIINDNIWFAIKNGNYPGEVKVVNSNGFELNTYSVGINPGDFAFWTKQ